MVSNINEILSSILNVSQDHLPSFKAFRIGVSVENRSRLVKVIFTSSEIALKIIQDKKKLPSNFQNITISVDRSKKQREKLSEVINVLEQRKHAGERNLTIKFVNGEPQIFASKSRNKRFRSEEESPARDLGVKTSRTNDVVGFTAPPANSDK